MLKIKCTFNCWEVLDLLEVVGSYEDLVKLQPLLLNTSLPPQCNSNDKKKRGSHFGMPKALLQHSLMVQPSNLLS